MKSPYPGMDPYLERAWRDVHGRLCIYACDSLQPQVRPALIARTDERIVVEAENYEARSIFPDVRVFEHSPAGFAASSRSAVGIAEPLRLRIPDDPTYEGFVQIIDPSNGSRVITVIEFLSMANKTAGKGADLYRKKVQESIEAHVSIVEIDLLRAGKWVLQANEDTIPASLRLPYRSCIRRSWDWGELEYYHFPIQLRLPKLRIPLREHDEDAILDLQELIDRIYVNGAYDSVDYTRQPVPPFDEETSEWSKQIIAQRNNP